jgi:inhibitor of cysteine peptidase
MEHRLVESDAGRTVDIHVGDTIRIVLPENATTGYRWEVDHCDREVLGIVSEDQSYPSRVPGSGGHVAFVLRGKRAGTGKFALKEWRQWEGDGSVIGRFRLQVNVLP